MPSTYTIDAPVAIKKNLPASGKYSAKTIYTLTLVDSAQQPTLGVELMQNQDTPAPNVGDTVEGELIQGTYGWQFKKNFDGRSSGSSGSGGYQRDPKERDSIVRQHSQQMAISWAVILDRKGLLPDRPDYVWLKGVIDVFDRDAKGEALQ